MLLGAAVSADSIVRKAKLNKEQIDLNDRKMYIHSQISQLQENREIMENCFGTNSSMVMSTAGSIFNSALSDANQILTDAKTALSNAKSNNVDSETIKKLEEQFSEAQEEAKQIQQEATLEYQCKMATVSSLTQAFKNLQAQQKKAEEKKLNQEETQIDLRLQNISAQITMIDKLGEQAEQLVQQKASKGIQLS